jgi:hypothetical protein
MPPTTNTFGLSWASQVGDISSRLTGVTEGDAYDPDPTVEGR